MIPGHHCKHLSQTCPCYLRVFLLCGSGRSEPLAGLSRIPAAKVRTLWTGPAWPSREAALIISPPGRGIRTLEAAPRARQCFPVLLTPNRAFGGFPGGTRAINSGGLRLTLGTIFGSNVSRMCTDQTWNGCVASAGCQKAQWK